METGSAVKGRTKRAPAVAAPPPAPPTACADDHWGGFVRQLEQELGRDGLSPAEGAFIDQLTEDLTSDDVTGLRPEDLAAVALEFWAFAETRPDAGPKVRVATARGAGGRELGLQALQVVQDDAPFLVDSVMGEVTEGGYVVKAMFHPVVEVGRSGEGRRDEDAGANRESMILVLMEEVSAARGEALVQGVLAALADARAAVGDFQAMRMLMHATMEELDRSAPAAVRAAVTEDLEFLRWLRSDHFVFLGARVYDYPLTAEGEYACEEPRYGPEGSFGVLRDQARQVLRRDSEPGILAASASLYANDPPLLVAKSNMRSRVHRRTNMDFIAVKRYGAGGRPIGEVRFVGLFTVEAYEEPVRDVPLIGRKVARVMERAAKAPGGHNEKRLKHILADYPRDELFQMTEDDLLRIALGIVHLYDRPRVRLFLRRDAFDRFASILLFVPRERYDASLQKRAGAILAKAWGGRVSAAYPSFSDAPVARVHFIIGFTPGGHPAPDLAGLEAEIVQALRTWDDLFAEALRTSGLEPEQAADIERRWVGAFPPGYRDLFGAAEAIADIQAIEAPGGDPIKVRAYRTSEESKLQFRFKLYREGAPAPLSDVMPILENMGLKGLIEEGLEMERTAPDGSRGAVWVHDFLLEDERGEHLVFEEVKAAFESAFLAVWTGRTENDGFNRLVLELGIPWREAALMRALARHRQQTGLDPSQAVQTAALGEFPGVARLILDLFRTKFDPAVKADLKARAEQAEAVHQKINEALQSVASLDSDRVLRRLGRLVRAIKRTNYYQLDAAGEPKAYISFKIASRELEELPEPKPYREIFVWAPHVEGVHLRFGPVARGGLRWSDRRDDFRTEVLSLAKAQQVKNAVIVPVGAKGGFYPKQLPRGGAPDQVRAEGVRAYRTFLCGLLDVTDNLDAKGEVITPPGVIAHDGDDPYLVVAADKGTATFSDIANGVAKDYGFWLGDAFASGGSAGYDHKAMGITAKGAWEAVKRHFREIGKNIQVEPFTVVGVGDMSGDVFGNGMLLSQQIRLIAAFDHRHVFIDPDPDPAASWAERKRLFDLPRSSWADYDPKLISEGGGVFPRTAKSIELSQEMRELLGVKDKALAPADLIKAVLRAPCELLYLGGIGTYVKAPTESDFDVGDKTNDAVRVNATELRCTVVGEGANLGFTQAGRIAFARIGGRIDTDAIDNSAGVDTSDHEVNIKILTGAAEASGRLKPADRNALLASMTDAIAGRVLAHNYDQTLALSLMEVSAAGDLDSHARLMAELVAEGRLDRKVETLPGPAAIAELAAAGKGLARPELAVLLAYGKLELAPEITASAAVDDPYFLTSLKGYFPPELERFEPEMKRHRLRREIIATVLANDMINMAGPSFPMRLQRAAEVDTAALVRFFEAARRILRLDEAWEQTNALDDKIPAKAQLKLYQELAVVLRRQTFWLARRTGLSDRFGTGVQGLIKAYRPTADTLRAEGTALFAPFVRTQAEARIKELVKSGAPRALAVRLAVLRPLMTVSNLADMARAAKWEVTPVARLYQAVGAAFALDRLRAAAGTLAGFEHYERMAVRRLIEDMLGEQLAITRAVIAFSGNPQAGADAASAKAAVQAWSAMRREQVAATRQTIEEIESSPGGWSFPKLTIVNAALNGLAAGVK
jgi:glutamate dehydrogenase